MSDERTTTVELDSGASSERAKHYNVDNIAYLDIKDRSKSNTSAFILGILGILFVLAGWGVFFTETDDAIAWSIVGIGVLVAGIGAYQYLSKPNGNVVIRTLTGDDWLSISDPENFEETFLDRSIETITINGKDDGSFSSVEYRYHFVPDNIVSVEHANESLTLREWVIIAIPILISLLLQILLVPTLLLILLGLLIGGLLFVVFQSRKSAGIAINLQSGKSRVFQMNDSDANQILQAFGSR